MFRFSTANMVNLQDSGVYKDAVRFWQKKLESCKFWKIKHAKFPQTKEKQTNNYIYIIYIYIYERVITTIVTLFCMIKTTQKGNDDKKCDKKPTFYENCNLSTGIMNLYTNQNNPSKLPSICIKNLIPPPKKNKSPIT